MTTASPWEYRMSAVDDDVVKLHGKLEALPKEGWELVSGGAACYEEYGQPRIRYVTYWRRPRTAA